MFNASIPRRAPCDWVGFMDQPLGPMGPPAEVLQSQRRCEQRPTAVVVVGVLQLGVLAIVHAGSLSNLDFGGMWSCNKKRMNI